MSTNATTPKVFISYSWTSASHQEWVLELAQRLMSDGIEVVIDQWDLKPGHDKYKFMESMVNSQDISRVLIILDKKYAERANSRDGGVGTETQIISPGIYQHVSQEKFIPIVKERDEDGNAYLPTYLESRIYIDLSSTDQYEENYEKLLRNIHNRPATAKPKVGKAPAYLFESTPSTFKTSSILKSFDHQMDRHPERVNGLVKSFLDEFIISLKEFIITFTNNSEYEVGRLVMETLNQYTTLRNDYLQLMDKVFKSQQDFDIDVLIHFFEKLPQFQYPQDARGSWRSDEFDHYKFIIHELFLYTMALCFKYDRYKLAEELLYSHYIIPDKYRDRPDTSRYTVFYYNTTIFDGYYREVHAKNYINPAADFILARLPELISREEILDADLICYYVSKIDGGDDWFPLTYVYKQRRTIALLDRLVSQRHFEKIKGLFGVQTITEFKDFVKKMESSYNRNGNDYYSNGRDRIRPFHQMVEIDKVGTSR